MHAEVIAIGDELTSGQRLDTNSPWLSQRLGEMGVRVLYHSTAGDDLEACRRVFQTAIGRADLVVATGGLGPTADDLTRDAVAAAAGTELVLDEAQLEHIRRLFARRGREMPERNVVQAMLPAGSRAVPNPHGTAPGIQMAIAREGDRGACHLFALPGVPAEMREMWAETVAGEIAAYFPTAGVIRHRRIKCFGVGESDLEAMMPDLIRRGRDPSVGITVSQATITLRVTAHGATPHEALATMQPTIATIHECLGSLVFGEEDDELQHSVLRLLCEQNATLATCEWGTGGLLAHWLHEAAGHEGRYLGGLVVGDEFAVRRIVGVSWRPADQGGDEEQFVREMAVTARQQTAAYYGLAVGPFPALQPAAADPPLFYIALATPDEVVTVKPLPFAGHPDILTPRAAKAALNLLRLALLRGA